MIDGREIPRRADPGDLGEPTEPPRRRLSRLATAAPVAKRIATTRIGMAVGAILLSGLLVSLIGLIGRDWVRGWVHSQAGYQLEFASIELDPPCPKWIKSGKAGILEKVRRGAKRPQTFSLLDINLDELANDFKGHSSWVARVDRVVASHPNKLMVQLRYREPVARLNTSGLYLDASSFVLPTDDIDPTETGSLLQVTEPASPLVGTVTPGRYHPDETLKSAANLAGFFKQRMSAIEPKENLARPKAVTVYHKILWVEATDKTMIRWEDSPGAERAGNPTAAEKWESYVRWANSPNRKSLLRPDFLYFTKKGLEIYRKD